MIEHIIFIVYSASRRSTSFPTVQVNSAIDPSRRKERWMNLRRTKHQFIFPRLDHHPTTNHLCSTIMTKQIISNNTAHPGCYYATKISITYLRTLQHCSTRLHYTSVILLDCYPSNAPQVKCFVQFAIKIIYFFNYTNYYIKYLSFQLTPKCHTFVYLLFKRPMTHSFRFTLFIYPWLIVDRNRISLKLSTSHQISF